VEVTARRNLREEPRQGLAFKRHFTRPGEDPFDQVEWERRDAVIRGKDGEAVFEQQGVEVPAFWSQMAVNVVVSKYFRGALGGPYRETSVRQLIGRVVDTFTGWGRESSFFRGAEDEDVFRAELTHVLVHQMASFNSPVWFNVGVDPKPQCSACFINAVEDTMPSIMDLAKTEALLFKHGSGTGSNLSSLRSSKEELSEGGTASGPVSFMRGFDAFAGVIKSGGRTRRAAKMVMLDIDHPDILDFMTCKQEEEKKARALMEAGWDAGFEVERGAYSSVFFQNANHSVRLSDSFLQAVEADATWTTRAVTDGRPMDTYPARDLLQAIAEAAWECGDPGVQFDTTIGDWHTCPESGPIRASNPCSEFMFLDDSACNLASVNLLRFQKPGESFDVAGLRHVCELLISAQELIVGHAGYPRPAIEENSLRFRPLGLGYANLGALLMALGLPYDSSAGRAYAAAVTALLCGSAYAQSARLAAELGPFEGFAPNREPMLRVLHQHRQALSHIDAEPVPAALLGAAVESWDEACELGERFGRRNSQVTALAPTGTIAFMMDCDTTGVEPDVALVKFKKLVGGGHLKMVNGTVPLTLKNLGYGEEVRQEIVAYVEEKGTIEGAPHLSAEDLPVFDCAFQPASGDRSITPVGHLKMVAAVQPFISGAISKTINLPASTRIEEIEEIYLEGWRLGLKAVAVYRDGCKLSQPLTTSRQPGQEKQEDAEERFAVRHRLPDERHAVTHKFSIGGHEGYVTVGLYSQGQPGEIFVVMAKEGSTISGLMDAFATSISMALQYGVPLKTLVQKFSHTRFEPSGFTRNPQVPFAKSITDYIFRWLASRFLSIEEQKEVGVVLTGLDAADASDAASPTASATAPTAFLQQQDAPPCHLCGQIMVRSGACYRCLGCGSTSGCG